VPLLLRLFWMVPYLNLVLAGQPRSHATCY
jgi:hypothetical protein